MESSVVHRRQQTSTVVQQRGRPLPPSRTERRSRAAKNQAQALENLLLRGDSNDDGRGLLPQLKKRHIGMISIGGAIGTGLFLGSGEALRNGGAAGILLGYLVMGTVVYCVVVSIGEMISFRPNCNGPVGLADRFVDKSLGFAMGWNAWYNWTIVLPTEISAASALLNFWDPPENLRAVWPAVFLISAIAVNCVGVGTYGEIEFWFSTIKILTIVMILITGIILDTGGGEKGPIRFQNWKVPFPQYLDIPGTLGQFLGFFAVMIQAAFSFFGSELPGVMAGEVINASQTVPVALKLTWLKILLFYVSGVFVAGLLVPSNHDRLNMDNSEKWVGSPFIIATQEAGKAWRVVPHIFIALFLISAWSAAAADVYISSRYLYFLAKSGHAPSFLGYVYSNAPKETLAQSSRPPGTSPPPVTYLSLPGDPQRRDPSSGSDSSMIGSDYGTMKSKGSPKAPQEDSWSNEQAYLAPPLHNHGAESSSESDRESLLGPGEINNSEHSEASDTQSGRVVAIPFVGILVAAAVAFMSFMSIRGSNEKPRTPEQAFVWLASMTAAASLQSWIGMLFTYLRWYQGIAYREKRNARAKGPDLKFVQEITELKKNRHWGQPWVAIYAFFMCFVVLFFHGWSILKTGQWRVYQRRGDPEFIASRHDERVATFITCYVPIPIFLLLTFGYKLMDQTKMVLLEDMDFSRDPRAKARADVKQNQAPKKWYRQVVWFLFS